MFAHWPLNAPQEPLEKINLVLLLFSLSFRKAPAPKAHSPAVTGPVPESQGITTAKKLSRIQKKNKKRRI